MTWSPDIVSHGCFTNFWVSTCHPTFITFLSLIAQHLSRSRDDVFSKTSSQRLENKYDFIIVGAGSAGGVLANRLSENADWKVLLLEEGDEQPLVTEVPALHGILPRSTIDYSFQVHHPPGYCVDNPLTCKYPSGKVMGGSSSINMMIYNRGNKYDYDDWEKAGNKGWAWKDVLPYFKKAEHFKSNNNPMLYGKGGHLSIESRPNEPNSEALLSAWRELGLRDVDYNSGEQIGSSRLVYTIKDGARQSTNDAYVRPIRMKRKNLTVRPNSHVVRVVIDPKSKRAIGVEYTDSGSQKIMRVLANKEVIVSAGVINSPKILMLSGVGPAKELAKFKIKVLADLPVGRNFHDHVTVADMSISSSLPDSSLGPKTKKVQEAVDFVKKRTGPFKDFGGALDLTAYLQTKLERRSNQPDIQVLYTNDIGHVNPDGKPAFYMGLPYGNLFIQAVTLLTMKSRGWVELNQTDPIWNLPSINPNVNSDPADVATMVEGMKMARKLVNTKAFEKTGFRAMETPSPACDHLRSVNMDKFLECFVRKHYILLMHGVGTCKMGVGNDAVVDPKLRVRGIEGLRVVDASVMPQLPRANTNAPVIMVAEKASNLIKEHWHGK